MCKHRLFLTKFDLIMTLTFDLLASKPNQCNDVPKCTKTSIWQNFPERFVKYVLHKLKVRRMNSYTLKYREPEQEMPPPPIVGGNTIT